MSQVREPRQSGPSVVPSRRWAGWTAFAAIMLAITGAINGVQGLVALFDDGYFVIRGEEDLLLLDFTAWGILMLIWVALLLLAGFSLAAGRGWARWFAIFAACLSIIVQIGFLSAYPIWSTVIIAFDVLVLFALTAHWEEARAGL
jgi:hypothetical protein